MKRVELIVGLSFGAGFLLVFLGINLNFIGRGARLEAYGDLFLVFGGVLFGVVPFLLEKLEREIECPECGCSIEH